MSQTAPIAAPIPSSAATDPSTAAYTPLAAALHVSESTVLCGRRTAPTASSTSHGSTTSQEVAALLRHAGVYDLGWLQRLRITGEDRSRWLNGMITNSVKALAPYQGCYSFLLNAQGRILGDAEIYALPQALLLVADAEQLPRLQAHLDHFIIMDDVELAPELGLTALGLAGPHAAKLLQQALGFDAATLPPGHLHEITSSPNSLMIARGDSRDSKVRGDNGDSGDIDQYTLWVAENTVSDLWQQLLAAGAVPCGSQAVEALRILSGTPRYGADIHEKTLAQETGQTRALNFNKGCYLGQEIVERVRSRATLNRSLFCFQLTGSIPQPGTALFAAAHPEQPVGQLTSVTSLTLTDHPQLSGIFALGTARTEAVNAPLLFAGGTAQALSKAPLAPLGSTR
jgi:folate-binding protein YgfZ